MKNWSYFELIATLYKSIFLYKAQGDSFEQAISRMGLDFWVHPENEHILENFILIIASISTRMSLSIKINEQLIKMFENQLLLINDEYLKSQIKENEIEHLKESIDEIKFKINNMKNL